MYFPYLRGRQYELLGIKEAIKEEIISENIIPIIEPVKLSSTLFSTIKVAINKEKEIAIICNSDLGSFSDDLQSSEKTEERVEFIKLLEDENIIKAFIIKEDWEEEIKFYKKELDLDEEDIMIICNDANYISDFEKRYDGEEYPKYILIPEEKRFRRKIKKNKVLLEDRFIKEDRNSDYLKNEDDFFSEDHLYYKDDNYIGFSDYVTIGEKFSDGGFAPYAVAIHLTYIDEEDEALRIHHFVSDSNDDIKDPAGKFYEAVRKVSKFKFPKNSKTIALDRFIEYYKEQAYPGLGTVKKLSLLHHLELIENILNSEEN